jgi:hypothetical protein
MLGLGEGLGVGEISCYPGGSEVDFIAGSGST